MWLAPTYTNAQICAVRSVTIDFTDCIEATYYSTYWDAILTCLESLSARPNILLVFKSPEDASTFRKDFTTPKMASLVTQGRLRYALDEEENKISLVERGENDDWQIVGAPHFQYSYFDANF